MLTVAVRLFSKSFMEMQHIYIHPLQKEKKNIFTAKLFGCQF